MRRYLVLAVAVWMAGCISNDRTLLIQGVTGFTDGCLPNTSETQFLPWGVLDVAPAYGPDFPLRYYNVLKVENFLMSTAGTASVDSNRVILEQARVRLEWLRGMGIPDAQLQNDLRAIANSPEQVFPLSAIIDAGTADKPGVVWAPVKLIDSVDIDPASPGLLLTNFFSDTNNRPFAENLILGLRITVEGTTTGGVSVESNEFVFPLEFCYGCLAAGFTGTVPFYTCCQDTATLADDYNPYCGGIQDAVPKCENCETQGP